MRNLGMLLALCASLMTASVAVASAADANPNKSNSTDPNFRFHNGKWWYWQATPQRWMVWNGAEWNPHQPRTVRTNSYLQDTGSQVYRGGQNVRPRSNSGRITESFGNRDAGSKARGNY